MSNLQRALKQQRPPGIYRFVSDASVDYMRDEAKNADWKFFVLNGSKIRDKQTFLEQIARVMKFPDYFGKNWDALNDCLTDLPRTSEKGFILLFESAEQFIKTSPKEWEVAVDILNTAIQFWKELNVPFYVLLRGSVPPAFPLL
jgi:hypothetical protein